MSFQQLFISRELSLKIFISKMLYTQNYSKPPSPPPDIWIIIYANQM